MARFDVGKHRDTDSGPARRFSVVKDRDSDDEREAESVRIMSREEFVAMFAEEYTPAHVTLIGPTQRGKSTLCKQLLTAVLARNPKWKVVILHGKIKGRDRTMEEWSKEGKLRMTRTYPPGPALRPKNWKRNTHGVILRPLKKDDISAAEEEKLLTAEFNKALRANYHSTRNVVITVIDERAQADKDLKLTKQLDAPLQRGLPHNPEWNNIQRGKWISYHCYDAPEHIFLFKSDDNANEERYAEFGCADPKVVIKILNRLQMRKVERKGQVSTISQCLYMRRSDRFMCIVDT